MKKRSGKKTAPPVNHPIRGLEPEDALLWHRITETLQPMDKKAQNQAGFDLKESSIPGPGLPPPPFNKQGNKPAKTQIGNVQPARPVITRPNPPGPPPINQIEKRLNRRIARGNTHFDARIDLHGMTQNEAHGALLGFLRVSQARGCRVALVITGKGRASDVRDISHGHFSMSEAPGVLRRSIRGWLEQADFRHLVAAYAQAHRRHGGDGAIYVQIRRDRS